MYRFLEIFPGALSWLTLILLVSLSRYAPAFVAVFIILFDIYWLLKTIYLSLHLRSTFSVMKKNLKVNWLNELKALPHNPNGPNRIQMPRIIEKDLSYKLSGVFFKVHNQLGRFCRERQYGDAVAKELESLGVNFQREVAVAVAGRKSNFVDFVVESKIAIELKTKDIIDKEDYFQLQRYLKALGLELGIIVNFRRKHLNPKRVLNSDFLYKYSADSDTFGNSDYVVNRYSDNSDSFGYSDYVKSWEDIYHLVILPMYREPYEVVKGSFESISKGNYPLEKLIVVLATEERAGAEARKTAEKIRREFGGKFFKFLITTHPANLPGEIPGKGSNETWAAKEAKRLIIDPLVNAQTYADNTQTDAENDFLYPDLTYEIRGAIFSIKKKLGLGHKEVVYQKALEEEFNRLGLNFEKEKTVDIAYNNKKVGVYRPDFVIEDKIILELKALPFMGKYEKRQVWQYLKGTEYKLAMLVNFGGSDIRIDRIVYDTARASQRKSALSQRESALKYENVLVSVFDIDTQIFPEYFGRLTYVFLKSEDKLQAIYQPIPLFINNIYDAPALARVISFSSTFWQMMQQSRPERLTSFSSQSIPLRALIDIGYWHKNVVSEDSRIFWQCYLRYHGNFRVEPLFYPVSMDANAAPTFWRTLKNNYLQHRRWAWGCENIPYLLCGKHNPNPRMHPNNTNRSPDNKLDSEHSDRFGDSDYAEGFLHNKKIPLRKKLYWSFNVIEGFHSWATNALIIFALGWLPVLLGGEGFGISILSRSLPSITRFIIQLSMVGVATAAFFSILLLPPRKEPLEWHQYIWYLLQWLLLPATLIIFGSIPALEAQTRLMVGGKWRLGFWPTPKTRTNNRS